MANAFAAAEEEQVWALLYAIRRHESIDEWLQDEHRGLLSMGDLYGNTPLICAARHGNAGATALLIEAGVDADQRMDGAQSALCLACDAGHVECAELLLGAGASVDLATDYGSTPLLAVTLAHSLYHVYLRRMERGGWQAVDFARHVLSHALCR